MTLATLPGTVRQDRCGAGEHPRSETEVGKYDDENLGWVYNSQVSDGVNVVEIESVRGCYEKTQARKRPE